MAILLQFLKILGTEFIAEMGDKTQLMLVGLTSKYKLRDIIIGTAAAILVLNGVAVLAGGLLGKVLENHMWIVKLIAAAAFLFFAFTSLKKDDGEEEKAKDSKIKFAPLAVFCTFFIAELGDKTQLTAVTFGANEGFGSAVVVWLACSIGLFLADVVGMLIGYLLKSKTPAGLINIFAFIIFAVFGVFTVYQGLSFMPENWISSFCPNVKLFIICVTAAVGVIFAVASLVYFIVQRKGKAGVEAKSE